jgi:excisionase family DNA binding protein
MENAMTQLAALPPLSVSVEEAARLTGFTRTGIYEVMAKGELQTFKIGKRRLILITELKAWIERAAKAGAR